MIATTTREITFQGQDFGTSTLRAFPAGTQVHIVRSYRNGTFLARVLGTLFEMTVTPSGVTPV